MLSPRSGWEPVDSSTYLQHVGIAVDSPARWAELLSREAKPARKTRGQVCAIRSCSLYNMIYATTRFTWKCKGHVFPPEFNMSLDFCRPTSEYFFTWKSISLCLLKFQWCSGFSCVHRALSIKAIIVLKHASTSRYKTAVVQTYVLAVM